MGASRRTALMVSGALCGALALGTTGSAVASAGFPPPTPPASPAAEAPSPESLREAAAGGARAIDRNVIRKRAAEAVKACRAAGPGAVEAAGGAQQGLSCTQVKEHLDGLNRARGALAREAAAAHPDLDRMTTAATDAAAATAYLAKDGVEVSDRGRPPGRGHGPHGHERYDGRGPGLLSLVTGVLGGLVFALGGVVGGLTGLVGGVLGGILD
ncbi:hypothetical protein [Streptomyces klenkii]